MYFGWTIALNARKETVTEPYGNACASDLWKGQSFLRMKTLKENAKEMDNGPELINIKITYISTDWWLDKENMVYVCIYMYVYI